MSLKTERAETAKYRFYMFRVPDRDQYPYQIHDAAADPKVIAKFKDQDDAASFLALRLARYAKKGE